MRFKVKVTNLICCFFGKNWSCENIILKR